MVKIFIDGKAGTTGLRIFERLAKRKDVEIINLSEEERKDVNARKKAINSSDVTFLCLPDDAARESVSLVENDNTVIIDTSTAHRTEQGWLYGFPEIDFKFNEKVKSAKRIAVPGCHASGFIALTKPLIDEGIIDKNALLTCTSITGYSGGGKKMIAEYESDDRDELLSYPRQYALGQSHKHLKEMSKISGLENAPCFMPIVAPFKSGMQVTIPLFKNQINKSIEEIKNVYKKYYNSRIVFYSEDAEQGFTSAGRYSKLDSMEISVYGNDERIILSARYDNLGKGASGAAIECLNYVTGKDKELDLEL
ncbi:MAG: N-acetyl-gamma-glutamyl-phosphate reductase [Clostridia bacterium]|nr:N-acetyl-gamma-glutamyl-phosphate reductase [Clostridia bacterium]